jgi:hypothetical protein
MTDIGVPFAGARGESVKTSASERFLTRPRVAGLLVFGLFAVTFDLVKVQDDGVVYFDFIRRVFGVQTGGVAYQFGSSFWNAPFWLASQLVAVRGGLDHFQAGQVAVAVASNGAILLTLYLGWRILRELDLPRGPVVLLLTLFGTPLFFYGVLDPSYKHAADTLYSTAAFWFVLRSLKTNASRLYFIMAGFCMALLLATRYANIGLALGAFGVFAVLGMRRVASWIACATLLFAVLFFALPIIRHIPYASPPPNAYGLGPPSDSPALVATSQRFALDAGSMHIYLPKTTFSPTAPLKMLFTLHRGIFIWTPLTFFATIGFVLLVRRDRRHRPFLMVLGASALGLLLIHSFWGGAWDGFGSFSNRFLTALFPLFLIGTAEFVRRTRRWGIAVLTLCTCFSLWIGLIYVNGYYNQGRQDGIVQVIENFKSVTGPRVSRFHQPPPYDSLENYGLGLGDAISARWRVYWRLVT